MSWSEFWDKIKDLGDIISESKKEFDDLTDELGEILTDGVVADIRGDKGCKTSFEIRDEANHIVYSTEEKYREAGSAFNNYLAELNKFAYGPLFEKRGKTPERRGFTRRDR